jgi:hypothetical protein
MAETDLTDKDRALLREAAEVLDAAQWMCETWMNHEETRLRINHLAGRLEELAERGDVHGSD